MPSNCIRKVSGKLGAQRSKMYCFSSVKRVWEQLNHNFLVRFDATKAIETRNLKATGMEPTSRMQTSWSEPLLICYGS